MGIVNVTPDSFSDGGAYLEKEAALRRACQQLEQGADLIDIGGESTRPGSLPIDARQEWKRIEPLLTALQRQNLTGYVSVDTRHPQTMLRCAELGVSFINNIYGLADETTMRSLAKCGQLGYVAMHMQGRPETMQEKPLSGHEAVEKVDKFFAETKAKLLDFGFSSQRVYLDPGVGFGKDDAANFLLLKRAREFAEDYQLLYGISRKSFIGRWLDIDDAKERDLPSKGLEAHLIMSGVHIIRTHDVKALVYLRKFLH